MEIQVEAPEGPQYLGIHELEEGVEIIQAVLHGRPREHEQEPGGDGPQGGGGAGAEILRPLGLVQDEHIGVEILQAGQFAPGQLVVQHFVGGIRGEGRGATGAPAAHDHGLGPGVALDLRGPLVLERGHGDHHDAAGLPAGPQAFAGGQGLHRLAAAHVIGEQGPAPGQEVGHPFALVGEKGAVQEVHLEASRGPGLLEGGGTGLAGGPFQHPAPDKGCRVGEAHPGQIPGRQWMSLLGTDAAFRIHPDEVGPFQEGRRPGADGPEDQVPFGGHGEGGRGRGWGEALAGLGQGWTIPERPAHGFQVLAGTQPVAEEIRAGAGVVAQTAIHHVHAIGNPAGTGDLPRARHARGGQSQLEGFRVRPMDSHGFLEGHHLLQAAVVLAGWKLVPHRGQAERCLWGRSHDPSSPGVGGKPCGGRVQPAFNRKGSPARCRLNERLTVSKYFVVSLPGDAWTWIRLKAPPQRHFGPPKRAEAGGSS